MTDEQRRKEFIIYFCRFIDTMKDIAVTYLKTLPVAEDPGSPTTIVRTMIDYVNEEIECGLEADRILRELNIKVKGISGS